MCLSGLKINNEKPLTQTIMLAVFANHYLVFILLPNEINSL